MARTRSSGNATFARAEQAHPASVPAPAALSHTAALQAWDATTLTCLRTLEGHEDNVRVLAVGQGSLFSGSWDKTVRVGASQPALAAWERSDVPAAALGSILLLLPLAHPLLPALLPAHPPTNPPIHLAIHPPTPAGVVLRDPDLQQGAGGSHRGSAGPGGGRPLHGQRQLRHNHQVGSRVALGWG